MTNTETSSQALQSRSLLAAVTDHSTRAEYMYDRFVALDSIVKECHDQIAAEVCTVFLRTPDNPEFLRIDASYSDRDLYQIRTDVRIKIQAKPGAGLTGLVASLGRPYRNSGPSLRKNTYSANAPAEHLKNGVCHSLFAAPVLSSSGGIEGILKVENKKGADGAPGDEIVFSAEDEELVKAAANAIGVLLDKAHRLEAFLTILAPLSSTLPDRDFLHRAADAMRKAFDLEGVVLYRADPKNEVLPAVVFSGVAARNLNPLEIKYSYRTPALATKVFSDGSSYVAKNPLTDEYVNPEGRRKFDISGPLAGVPISAGTKKLGVLVFWVALGQELTDVTVHLVEKLAVIFGAYITERHIERSFGIMCHTLLENLPASVFIKDEQKRFLFCNKAFCDFVGRTFDGLMGKTDLEIFTHTPEVAEKFIEDDQAVLQSGEPLTKLERSCTVNGEVRFVQVAKALLRLDPILPRALQGVFIDVTKARIAEAANFAHVGYWWWDIDRASDKLNGSKEIHDLFELNERGPNEPDYSTFQDIFRRIVPEDRSRIEAVIEEIRKNPVEFSNHFRMRRADGTIRAVEIRGKPSGDVTTGGVGKFMIGTLRDISEDVVQGAKDEQVARVMSADELASAVQHDITNVLGVAQIAWTVLNKEKSEEVPWMQIRVAVETAMQLSNLLGSIFKTGVCEIGIYDLNSVVRGAIQLEEGEMLNKEIRIVTELAEDLPMVYANHGHLVAAVHNLLKNAREASPFGGKICIHTSSEHKFDPCADQVKRSVGMLTDSIARIRICDEGPGLTAVSVKRRFQMGFSTKGPGRGTGLYSCRKIANLYGGSVTIENRSDRVGAVAEIMLKGTRIKTI